MRIVIHRINAPLAASAMMIHFANPIERRIAHVNVRRCHINFGAQRLRPVGKLPRSHAREQIEVLVHGTISPGTLLARNCRRAAIFDQFIGGEIAHVRFAQFD